MSHSNSIAILGIHTGIGKTIASAVIAEAMGADYWKPVQAGYAGQDSIIIRLLLTNGYERVHKDAVTLSQPISPHAAAIIDNVDVDYTRFAWPETDKKLIVETAGGVLSPMSATKTMADFVAHYKLPAILVAQNYLGSINHTLISIEAIRKRGIKLLGIVMNDVANEMSEGFIEEYSKTKIIARIPHLDPLLNTSIVKCAAELKDSLSDLLNEY